MGASWPVVEFVALGTAEGGRSSWIAGDGVGGVSAGSELRPLRPLRMPRALICWH